MAGLLNLVPQYLPRFGMAPEWSRAVRPLVILFTVINLFVNWIFNADVVAQGGAYATGVLVLMTSRCVATVIDRWRTGSGAWPSRMPWFPLAITVVFVYTTATNMIERPDGIKIASWFIMAIVVSSFGSRLKRSTELRFKAFEFMDLESKFLWDSLKHYEFPVLVPHRPGRRHLDEKEASIRQRHRLSPDVPIVFIEAELGDPSEFQQSPLMEVLYDERPLHHQRQALCVAGSCDCDNCPGDIASRPTARDSFRLVGRRSVGRRVGFFLFGAGNIPWRVRDLIRKAEPDEQRHPKVIVG